MLDASRLFSSRGFCVIALWLLFAGVASAQTLQPFFAPPTPAGSMTVRLHPMENVAPGAMTLVTFGVPFPRGSLTAADLATVRVLRGGVEVPAFVEMLTPWRHLSNAGVDGQSARVARIQFRFQFAVSFPQHETVTVEWGGPPRSQNVAEFTNPRLGWHVASAGTFVAADGIMEPDVYALLPKEVLAQGALNLRRLDPAADHLPATRDDPSAMDAIGTWPGYEEADRAFKNSFFTTINEDDPQVTEFGDGRLSPYKTSSEPWLYDRSSTFFLLYLKTGFLRPLREAVRSTQFYRSQLHGAAAAPATSAGIFRLKQPDAAGVNGGNDAMYSYAECFAYDYWLTGNPDSLAPIRWVAATHNAHTEPTRWAPELGAWTERHTAFSTLANLVAFEVTGEAAYRQTVLAHIADYLWHQNGAGGQLPAGRLDGGLYHYGRQHGDGDFAELIASPWMMSLSMDAMARAYGMSEDPAIASFITRAARFQAAATHFDENHTFDTAGAALRYPHYLTRHDGAPDTIDGYDGDAINHALEVAATVAWGAYFHHLQHQQPDPALEAAARELYGAFDVGVNHWIRPAAPPLGFTAFRVVPWRKLAWEHRPAASLSWVMRQIDQLSPPPIVTITSPADLQTFTAPASILIEATASAPNAAIEKVEFFAGGTKLGEDATSPYAFQWNGVIANLQGYTITARATTVQGVTGQSPGIATEVVSPTRPTLTITSPQDGANFTAPAQIEIVAEVVPEAPAAVARVVFMRDGIVLAEDSVAPFSLTLVNVLAGTQEFEVRAFDSNGGYDLGFVTVSVTTPTPPAITLAAPTPGIQTAGGATLELRAQASAPGSAVMRVEFFADGVPIGEDATAPYEWNFTVPMGWSAGSHTIAARAVETNGGTATATVTVEMLTLAPITVAFETPAENQTFFSGELVQMRANAAAPGAGITRVEFFANGQPIGLDTEAPFTASFTPDARQWSLTARAFDQFQRQASATRTIHVGGVAQPSVTLTAPADGAILGAPATATLTADAAVAAGTITRVVFYDGSSFLGEDTVAPFSLTTPELTIGEHRFSAVAFASNGLSVASAAVTVAVGAANSPVAVITAPRFSGPQVGTFAQFRFAAGAAHTGGGAIARVEFWLDQTFVGVDEIAPYEMDWQVGANYGYHELQARAFDGSGLEGRSSVAAFELIQPPVIVLEALDPSRPPRPLLPTTLTAAVTPGTYGITEVRFFANDTLIGADSSAPHAVNWTPPSPGPYTLEARVFDARGLTRSSEPISVSVVYSAAQTWRFTHFGTYLDSGGAADLADPDGDGELNLLEFATGQNPLAGTLARVVLSIENGALEFTYDRNPAAALDGVSFSVEWRDELQSGTWTNEGVSSSVVSTSPGSERIAARIPSGMQQRFARLRVSTNGSISFD